MLLSLPSGCFLRGLPAKILYGLFPTPGTRPAHHRLPIFHYQNNNKGNVQITVSFKCVVRNSARTSYLTAQSRVLKKLIVAQLVKKFTAFYEPDQSTPHPPITSQIFSWVVTSSYLQSEYYRGAQSLLRSWKSLSLFKKSPVFNGTQSLIIVFTRVRHWALHISSSTTWSP
jgi:hypothetical protein